MSALQALDIYIAVQKEEPEGWDSEKFGGDYPAGGTNTVKGSIAPTHKSWRTWDNHHDVTAIIAVNENAANHLNMGPKLSRVVTHNCTCLSGSRTNSACSHVAALLVALQAPTLFHSTKVNEPRIGDPEK